MIDFIKIFEPKNPMCIVCNERFPKSYAHYLSDGLCLCDDCNKLIDRYKSTAAFKGRENLEFHISAFPYKGRLRDAFIKYKFYNNVKYNKVFSKLLTEAMESFYQDGDFDLIIPVPISRKRFTERGFNQSAFLAKALAEHFNIEYSEKALYRIKHTKRQSELSVGERIKNVQDAFLARKDICNSKRILLVDDIFTVGATMGECAKELKAKGAKSVCGITLFQTISPEIKNRREYEFKKN